MYAARSSGVPRIRRGGRVDQRVHRIFTLNGLIGANGAGKTNFISFFKFPNQMVEKRLELWLDVGHRCASWICGFTEDLRFDVACYMMDFLAFSTVK